jgi:tetratricopeptide (TPR) repeat protein
MSADGMDLNAYMEALRSGDDARAAELLRQIAHHSQPQIELLSKTAWFDVSSGNHGNAGAKLEVMAWLRPDELDHQRRLAEICIETGRTDDALDILRKLAEGKQSVGFAGWRLEALLRLGEMEAAYALIEDEVTRARFTAFEIDTLRALICYWEGLDLRALELAGRDVAGSAFAKHVYARVLDCQMHFGAAVEYKKAYALQTGGGIENVLNYLVEVFRLEEARDFVAEMVAKFPWLEPRRDEFLRPIEAKAALAEEVVSSQGRLDYSDRNRLYRALHENVSAYEIEWGKLSLVELTRSGDIEEDDVDHLLRPFGNWEIGIALTMCLAAFLKKFPNSPRVRQGYLGVLERSGNSVETKVEIASRLTPEEMSEDIAFSAIYNINRLRDLPSRPPETEQLIAAGIAAVRSFLDRADLGFLVFSQLQLKRLGIESPLATRLREQDTNKALQDAAIEGHRPWSAQNRAIKGVVRTHRPKIVVALSGQMRGFDRCWNRTYRLLVKPIGAPVFVSVWNQSQNALGRHANRLQRALPADVLARLPEGDRYTDSFARQYPRTFDLVFGKRPIAQEDVVRKLEASGVSEYMVETEDESVYERTLLNPPYIQAHTLLKMYAKFFALDRMMSDHELTTGEAITHVAWIRPDAYLGGFNAELLRRWSADDNTVWSSISSTAVLDYFIFMPRPALRRLGEVFSMSVASGNPVFRAWMPLPRDITSRVGYMPGIRGPEHIAYTLFANGFKFGNMPQTQIKLLGYTPDESLVREMFDAEQAERYG